MKTLLLILISSITFGQKLTQQVFEGKINNKFGITLTLTTDGNLVYGQVVYKKEPIQLVGTKEGNDINFREFDNKGHITGTYYGKISGDVISGSWYSSKPDAADMTFTVQKTAQKQVEKPIIANLTGTYNYDFGKDRGTGTVEVQQIGKDKIAVGILSVNSGPSYNMAIIDKTILKLSSNQAIYSNNEYGKCKFKLVFAPNGLSIFYLEDAYDCGFGHNASVVGNYLKTDNKVPKFESLGN